VKALQREVNKFVEQAYQSHFAMLLATSCSLRAHSAEGGYSVGFLWSNFLCASLEIQKEQEKSPEK
jgi:hypothetical protein